MGVAKYLKIAIAWYRVLHDLCIGNNELFSHTIVVLLMFCVCGAFRTTGRLFFEVRNPHMEQHLCGIFFHKRLIMASFFYFYRWKAAAEPESGFRGGTKRGICVKS